MLPHLDKHIGQANETSTSNSIEYGEMELAHK